MTNFHLILSDHTPTVARSLENRPPQAARVDLHNPLSSIVGGVVVYEPATHKRCNSSSGKSKSNSHTAWTVDD